jgi:hypothetical protein
VSATVKREHREIADRCWRQSNDPAGEDFGPELFAQAIADLEQATEARVRAEELAPWKRLASSIVEAEEAGDVVFRQCAWSSDWSAEFYRLARALKAAVPETEAEELLRRLWRAKNNDDFGLLMKCAADHAAWIAKHGEEPKS